MFKNYRQFSSKRKLFKYSLKLGWEKVGLSPIMDL